jgi:hypothetical protein
VVVLTDSGRDFAKFAESAALHPSAVFEHALGEIRA